MIPATRRRSFTLKWILKKRGLVKNIQETKNCSSIQFAPLKKTFKVKTFLSVDWLWYDVSCLGGPQSSINPQTIKKERYILQGIQNCTSFEMSLLGRPYYDCFCLLFLQISIRRPRKINHSCVTSAVLLMFGFSWTPNQKISIMMQI